MRELAYLLCEVLETNDREHHVKSWLADDTEFDIRVPLHMAKLIENTENPDLPQRAWVQVHFSGENATMQASITLPRPSLQYGNKVTVATKHIMRADEEQREREDNTPQPQAP